MCISLKGSFDGRPSAPAQYCTYTRAAFLSTVVEPSLPLKTLCRIPRQKASTFFGFLGLFPKKVFRLQLFVSIVGLAEAVPAGLQGPLRLVAPHDPPAGCSRLRPRSRDVGQEPLPERPFLMVGRRKGVTWAAEGQWLRPSRFWVQWIKHPDRFLRFIPKRTGFALGFSRA